MDAFRVWLAVILIGGGLIAALGGHLWEGTARLLRFFGKEISEDLGSKVMMGGVAAILLGFGLIFFLK